MGAYATVEEFKRRLGSGVEGLYRGDVAAMEADLAAAAAEIDVRLGMRYDVPVTAAAVCVLLASWNLTLAEELAWGQSIGLEEGKRLARRLENVRKLLDQVADGTLKLSGAVENSGRANAGVLVDIAEPVASRKQLAGY